MTADEGAVQQFLEWWMRATYEYDTEMLIAMYLHRLWWGVPIGPTMSMAHPPKLRGILAEVTP